MTTLILKKCSKCGFEMPVTDFYKNVSKNNGLSSHCKNCTKKINAKWTLRNNEKVSEYNKEWRKNNKVKTIKYRKKWSSGKRKIYIEELKKNNREQYDNIQIKAEFNRKFGIKPQELIEVKRLQLTLHRLIKKHEHL
jgi:hypothetical protein